jgi:pimeloyl-ACP methyl ester carboxylesterase
MSAFLPHRRALLKAALPAAFFLAGAHDAWAIQSSGSDRFSVVVKGDGPDVVLIPGLTSSREVWGGLTEHLLRKRFRVHLIQISGFGGAPAGGNGSGEVIAPFVEDLAGYLADHGIERPAVIGHSLGGEAGLMLAARHPDRVGRLMVIDAVPFSGPLFFGPTATAASIRPQADQIRDRTLGQSQADFAKAEAHFIGGMVKSDAGREARMREAMISDRSVVARAMHELMLTDLTPELKAITAPVTVVCAWDAHYAMSRETLEASFRSAYAGLKGVKLVRIDDSYHFVMVDQPERFAAEVDAFLA